MGSTGRTSRAKVTPPKAKAGPTGKTKVTPPKAKARKTGRPAGVVYTKDQKQIILGLVERGGTDHTAATAAGIQARTYREHRQRAYGTHPTRSALPHLREFFEQVDQAAARARIKREIEIADTNPALWLKNKARSIPGLEGWTEPVPDEPEDVGDLHVPSTADVQQMVDALIASGAVIVPACPDPVCHCIHHKKGEADGEV